MATARLERVGAVAEVAPDGPPLNLVDAAMVADLEAVLGQVAGGDARAVLLRAEGTVFCAGVDVHEFQDLSTAQGSALMARMLALTQAFEALPAPTLGVVHGLDLTIGFELVAESPAADSWQSRLCQPARSRP
jgi:enoyl-CoA hydratase/carnithine racemase